MEKVKHSSLEYAVQHDGPAYRQRPSRPTRNRPSPSSRAGRPQGPCSRTASASPSATPSARRREPPRARRKGAAKGAAKGVLHSPRRGAGDERGHRPFRRQRPDRRRGGARRRHRRQRGDDPCRPAQSVPRWERPSPTGLRAERARRRMARWDAKSKKALAKQDKVLDQLEHKRKRADTMRRAGMSDKSLLGALDQPQAEAAREQGGTARRQGGPARRDEHLRHPRQAHAAAPHQGDRHEHRLRLARRGRGGRPRWAAPRLSA